MCLVHTKYYVRLLTKHSKWITYQNRRLPKTYGLREKVIQDHCADVKSVWIRDKRLKIPGFFWTVPHESNGDARKVEIYRKVVVKYIVMLRRKMRICYKTPAQIKKEDDEAFKIHLDVSHLDTNGTFATTGMSSAVIRALQLPDNADLVCMLSKMDGARRRLTGEAPQVVVFLYNLGPEAVAKVSKLLQTPGTVDSIQKEFQSQKSCCGVRVIKATGGSRVIKSSPPKQQNAPTARTKPTARPADDNSCVIWTVVSLVVMAIVLRIIASRITQQSEGYTLFGITFGQ